MHKREVNKSALILLVICLGLFAIVLHQARLLRDEKRKYTYVWRDVPFIRKAGELWSDKSHEPLAMVMRGRFPLVLHLGEETCVELRLSAGSLGGNPVYCFNQHSGHLTRRFDMVE
jgi:hypothetical protein